MSVGQQDLEGRLQEEGCCGRGSGKVAPPLDTEELEL